MVMPDTAWRSLLDTHLANLRSHRAVLDHMVSLFGQSDGGDASAMELEAMRSRAERIWEDAVRAGELLNGDALRGRTPAETPTPSKPRRISSGAEIDRAGSPIPEEEHMEDADGDNTPESKRIVVANIPPGTSETDLRQHLRDYTPIKLKHAIRPPKKSETHIYALPTPTHTSGLAKIDLPSAAAAAHATHELDGSRLHRAALVVRRYRAGVPVKKAATATQKRCAGSGQQPAQRDSKRQRTGEAAGPTSANGGEGGGGGGGGGDAAQPTYPFTFTVAAATAAAAVRREHARVEDVNVSFEDISAEVEARLAEQAARRAEVKRKGDGAAVGRKRKRSSAGAEGVEEEAAACAAIAGMALVDGPRKRARGERRSGEGVVEDERGGVPMTKTRRRKEKRRERMEKARGRDGEGERLLDESPRPMKRTRVSGVDGAPS